MSATPDALIVGESGVVEAKLVGFRSIWMWGPGSVEGKESDAVPHHYLTQALWQLEVTGRLYVDIAALMGTEFRTYRIHRNEALQTAMVARCEDFWFKYVVTGHEPPPDASEGCREVLKRLYPHSQAEPVQADHAMEELAERLRAARKAADEAARERTLYENQLRAILKDARGAHGKGWRIRYAEQSNGKRPFVFETIDG
jgi:predicted phage-related endonuclease